MPLVKSKGFLFTLVFVVLMAIFFKPIAVYSLEKFLVWLLETPVKVKSLDLSTLIVHASLREDKNHAYVQVNQLYPLDVYFTYKGNANAFEVYQPVKGWGEVEGKLYYKDFLKVDGNISVLGANSKVVVQESLEGWGVLVNFEHLDLHQLMNENNVSVKASGRVNGDVYVDTTKDSRIKLYSTEVQIEDDHFKNPELNFLFVNDNIDINASFYSKNIEYKNLWFQYDQNSSKFKGRVDVRHTDIIRSLNIKLDGKKDDANIIAKVDVTLGVSHLKSTDIKYNIDSNDFSSNIEVSLKNLQKSKYLDEFYGLHLQGGFDAKLKLAYTDEKWLADLTTQSFGGETHLSYKDEVIKADAKKLELSKTLAYFKESNKAEGKVNATLRYSKEEFLFNAQSKGVNIEGERLENIDLKAEGKSESIYATLALDSAYAKIKESRLHIKNLKVANIDANLTTPYTNQPIAVNAKVSYLEKMITSDLRANSSEFDLVIPYLKYENSKAEGNFTASIDPRFSQVNEEIKMKGLFTYENDFLLKATSKLFGAKLALNLKGDKLNLQGKGFNVEKVLMNFKQAPYLRGDFDLNAKGKLDALHLDINAKRLQLNKNETGLDENLSCQIKADLSSKSVIATANIQNRFLETSQMQASYLFKEKQIKAKIPFKAKYKKKEFLFQINTEADVKQSLKAELSLIYKKDRLDLHQISYENEKLEADVYLDIEEFYTYNTFHDENLYGPLEFKGKVSYFEAKPYADVNTTSFDGNLNILFEDKDLHLHLKDLSPVKIGNFYKGKGIAIRGQLSGDIDYNIETNIGKTRLSGTEIELKGLDIDQTLESINDMLSLNLYAVGKTMVKKRYSKKDVNLTTEISQLEFDVDITAEDITSKDIALATEKSRFSVNTVLKRNGDIESFKVAVLDKKGCAIVTQKLAGNIKSPKLVDTKVASVIIGKIPSNLFDAGGNLIHAGAGVLDTAADFIWKKAFRQDSNISYVNNGLKRGVNIFSSGESVIVSEDCDVFYSGVVKPPLSQLQSSSVASPQ